MASNRLMAACCRLSQRPYNNASEGKKSGSLQSRAGALGSNKPSEGVSHAACYGDLGQPGLDRHGGICPQPGPPPAPPKSLGFARYNGFRGREKENGCGFWMRMNYRRRAAELLCAWRWGWVDLMAARSRRKQFLKYYYGRNFRVGSPTIIEVA